MVQEILLFNQILESYGDNYFLITLREFWAQPWTTELMSTELIQFLSWLDLSWPELTRPSDLTWPVVILSCCHVDLMSWPDLLSREVLWCVVSCHVVSCVMLCYVSCCVMCHVISYVMLCHVSCHVSYHIISQVMLCVMSCHV